MKNLIIGVCTYNRKNIIKYSSRSLSEIEGIEKVCVKIYDDCSTEYDEKYLKEIYPMASEININKKNIGADYNTKKMIEDFYNSSYDYLFIADSDLIFNTDLLLHIDKRITELEKQKKLVIFSVLNIPTHKAIESYDDNFEIKKDVGAAGTVISKEAVKKFIDMPYSGKLSFDNFYCNILRERGDKIFCTKKSYVQHIGLVGQNSFVNCVDIGINFKIDSINNAGAMIDILQKAFIWNELEIEDILYKYCAKGKIEIKILLKCIWICIKRRIREIFE